MSPAQHPSQPGSKTGSDSKSAPGSRGLAGWQKVAAALALVVALAGGAWKALGGRGETPGAQPAGSSSLVGGTSSTASVEPSPGDEYGPALMKVGFGFLIGLSIGVFLRTSLRLALVFAGFFALALLGLEKLSVVDVHWEQAGDIFERSKSALAGQFESFKGFLQGELPGGGAAVAGLFSGFRRR